MRTEKSPAFLSLLQWMVQNFSFRISAKWKRTRTIPSTPLQPQNVLLAQSWEFSLGDWNAVRPSTQVSSPQGGWGNCSTWAKGSTGKLSSTPQILLSSPLGPSSALQVKYLSDFTYNESCRNKRCVGRKGKKEILANGKTEMSNGN